MKDEWNGFAVSLANLIEKYAVELDIDSMPDPIFANREKEKCDADENAHEKYIEDSKAA